MKYFVLSEVLLAIPAALVLGALGAFLYRLTTAAFMCIMRLGELGAYISAKLSKSKYKFKREDYASFYKHRSGFIVSEIAGFFFSVLFGIVFTILLYIVSDGIVRFYILAFLLLSFILSMRLLERPLSLLSLTVASTALRAVFFIAYTIAFIPIKLWRKRRRPQKDRADGAESSMT